MNALSYVTGTRLKCQRTYKHFDHRHKQVQLVKILLPEDAPQWAKDLQHLVSVNRQTSTQKLSDIVEAAEKRIDSQVYREVEFALPRELTDPQNIKLAQEFIQDQCCKMGMFAVLSFHFDVDDETGERYPHCHVLLLTRRLTDQGLETKKERKWNNRNHLDGWREQWAAYANFHLRLHGLEANLDHRSNAERGLGTEPQPKLGRNVQEKEARVGINIQSLTKDQNLNPATDKGQAFHQAKLRNIYRLMARPEIVFDIVTEYQSTFMWGDVQKVLARYIDDILLFQRLDAQLKESKEMVILKEIQCPTHRKDIKDSFVYTSRSMLNKEQQLVQLVETLHKRKTHPIKTRHLNKTLVRYNQKFAASGGLSPDQFQAIQHMVSPHQLSCVVGYAGAGKTTALEVAKETWEKSGYKVYGLAPTGRARENLNQNSFKSFTLHKFLKDYENGRCHFKANTVLVLDEGGMVNTQRFQEFLGAVEKLGVKAVIVGDGAQLQPVEAGPAFRLITERVSYAKLEYVVRQKEQWQKEATVLFGQNKTREALEKYYEHGCFKVCSEKIANLGELMQKQDFRGVVMLYNLSRRVAGNIYHEIQKDIQQEYFLEKDIWKYLSQHVDYTIYKNWRDKRDECAAKIEENLDQCRSYMKELGVNPIKFALNFVDKELGKKEQIKQAEQLAKEWQLPTLAPHQKQHVCDPRAGTKEQLVKDWYKFYQEKPASPRLMMSYSNSDVRYMNDQARFLLKQDGVIDKTEFIYIIHRKQDTDFGKSIVLQEDRAFAKGDRLIFTENNRVLGVSNSSIGTIVSLDRNNIKVRLDNSEEVVSFAPKLYPHFEQGWAATIHKNQGVTVDDALLIASFEMFRNLAYVGMTRHRFSVTLYASDLDFWKEEKIKDRLSRSHEKSSSFDYIETKQVFELMKEDDKLISKLFDRLGNQLEAIRYVSKRVFEEVSTSFFNKTSEYESPFHYVQDSISEADRAREFSKDTLNVNTSYRFIASNHHHQMSNVRVQMSEANLGKGF